MDTESKGQKNILKYWTEAFENDPFYKDHCEQESSINLVSVQCALDNLKRKDWKNIKDGLVQISGKATYNSGELNERRTDVVKAVLYHIDKPSVVTRCAVETIKDMIVNLGEFSDKEWEQIFSTLLRYYAVAPSKHVTDGIRGILKYIIDEIPYKKSALFLTLANDVIKYKKSRELLAELLNKVVIELGPHNILTENDNIGPNVVETAAKMLMVQSDVTRYYGKKIFCLLMVSRAFGEFLIKHLPPNLLQKAADIINVIKLKGVGKKFKYVKVQSNSHEQESALEDFDIL